MYRVYQVCSSYTDKRGLPASAAAGVVRNVSGRLGPSASRRARHALQRGHDGAAAGRRAACAAELRQWQRSAAGAAGGAAQPRAAGGASTARAQGTVALHVKESWRSLQPGSPEAALSARARLCLITRLGQTRPVSSARLGHIVLVSDAGAAASAAGWPSGTACAARCPRWRRCGACGASSPSSRRRSSATPRVASSCSTPPTRPTLAGR